MAQETKKMSYEDAVKLLKSDLFVYNQEELDMAMKIGAEVDPNHPLLREVKGKIQNKEDKNKLAQNEVDVYTSNMADFERITSDYDYASFLAENSEINGYVTNIDLTEETKTGVKKLSDKRKEQYLSLLYDAAKLKAQSSLAGNVYYTKLSEEDKQNLLKEEIKNTFIADFARVAIAPYIKMPNKKEEKLGSKENRRYVLRQVENAVATFKDFISNKKKIAVKNDYVLASLADSSAQIEAYVKGLRKKAAGAKASVRNGFLKVAKTFQDKKNKIEKVANNISKNRYAIWKNIKGSFKDNKIKLIGNISASAIFGAVTAGIAAGTVGAPLTAAVGVYAAYHAAGSWVYPVIAEMRKINRLRREAGKKPLKFKEQLKQAWKNKTSKDEQKNSYKARNTYIVNGVVNTSLAAIGFGFLKNGLEAIDDVRTIAEGASEGINIDLANSIAETKHAVSMGRIAIPLAGQFTDAAVTYGISFADPDNKEKKQEAQQTAVAALVGAGFSALAQGIGYAIGSASATENVEALQSVADGNASAEAVTDAHGASSGSLFSKLKGLFSFGDKPVTQDLSDKMPSDMIVADSSSIGGNHIASDSILLRENINTEPKLPDSLYMDSAYYNAGNVEGTSVDGLETTGYVPTLFPKEYNEDMGISLRQYNTLVSTTEGTLRSASGEEVTLDRAYMNLTDEVMQNFPDQTREQVLYKFNRLYAFLRRAYEVGDGTLRETPSGYEYLETRFEKMNLNLSTEQMNDLVDFAQDNTYASTGDIKDGLKDILPEGTNAKTLSAIVTIVHSNQRFYQHAGAMENLIKLLGCGEQINAQEAVKMNALLEQTDNILATGKNNNVFTGLNLEKGCLDDDGQWMKMPETKVVVEEKPVVEQPKPPVHEEIKPRMMAAPKQEETPPVKVDPVEENHVVTKSVSSNVHGVSNDELADKSKELTGRRAERWIERAPDEGIKSVVNQEANSSTQEEYIVRKSDSTNVIEEDESKVLRGARARRLARKASRD